MAPVKKFFTNRQLMPLFVKIGDFFSFHVEFFRPTFPGVLAYLEKYLIRDGERLELLPWQGRLIPLVQGQNDLSFFLLVRFFL